MSRVTKGITNATMVSKVIAVTIWSKVTGVTMS
jgi:hypothetical protein